VTSTSLRKPNKAVHAAILTSQTVTRILIVDDSVQVRTALRMCLELNKDWTVCGEVDNGQAAIEMVRRLKPDVVLLDYAMPLMNGVEAARRIAEIAPECAILMFTMYASEQLSAVAHAAGVRAVVSKDVGGISALVDRIREVSGGAGCTRGFAC
jgi:DNA-binding NarL/FixJ family response regulator